MRDAKPTIDANIRLAMGLYPSAQWTPELLALWRERLSGLHQDIVAEAITLTKPKYSSHQPEIKWVLGQYGELYEQRHPTFQRETPASLSSWHVSWQRTSRHGVPNAWYGCRVQTREEAARLAKEMGGRSIPMNPADEPYSEREALQEVAYARRLIEGMPRERIDALLERLRRVGFCKDKLPGRVSDWSRMAVLAVYAAHQLQHQTGETQ